MKKVLFVVSSFGCGGINRSLQNLLSFLSKENNSIKYEILVVLPYGQYQNEYKGYEVKTPSKLYSLRHSNYAKAKGLNKVCILAVKSIDKITKGSISLYCLNRTIHRILKENYTSIIAFSEGLPTGLVAKIPHKNKIAWIHCDYQSYLTVANTSLAEERKMYSSFNKIVNVSHYTSESFTSIFPEFACKSIAIHNTMDVGYMMAMAHQPICNDSFKGFNGIKLVTVGRIDHIKNQHIIPSIASELKKKDISFKWYIIGPNVEECIYSKLESDIKKYGLEDDVLLLGEQSNPYPYIKNASLLVNTSKSEACPYVVNEAKILGTPVVCPNFGSAKEFIENGKEGYAVSQDLLAETIINLINDIKSYSQIKSNLSDFRYNNNSLTHAVLSLLK